MCSVFGLIDYAGTLNCRMKNHILNTLARICEARGTDATGIAYHANEKLCIYKRPLPAHRMKFRVPPEAKVIMGHTRMTTQGNAKFLQNNHPFRGKLEHAQFALAHNGVLWNDSELRITEKLPQTSIETDSYIAVQLLEKYKALDFNSLKCMAEKVEGSFVFTLLDQEDSIWFVRGNNPLAIFRYDGFVLYASTSELLKQAERRLKLCHISEILTDEGDILRIDRYGGQSLGHFNMPLSYFRLHRPWFGLDWDYEDDSSLDDLFEIAKSFGIQPEQVQMLLDYGCSTDEIEELFYDPVFCRSLIEQLQTAYA